MPGEITDEILLELREFNLFLDNPVPGLRRMALEREPARRPDIDEIGRNAGTVSIVNPPMRNIGDWKKRGVDDQQHKADVQQWRGNLTVARRNHRAGWGRGHATSCSRGARALAERAPQTK